MTFGSFWGHFGRMIRICAGLELPFSISLVPASIFWRVKRGARTQRKRTRERAEISLCEFGITLGSPSGYCGVTLRNLKCFCGHSRVAAESFCLFSENFYFCYNFV